MSSPAPVARISEWLRAVAVDRAEHVVPVPGGVVLLHSGFPLAHDHNRALLWSDDAGIATDVSAAVDEVMGAAGLSHRRIDVLDDSLADRLEPALRSAGYDRADELVMRYDGAGTPATKRPVPTIVELSPAARAAAGSASWALDEPEFEAEVVDQLGLRVHTLDPAVEAVFLAVLGVGEGLPVSARVDLYLRDGVGQIEDVWTLPAARNRGLASAVVRSASERAGQRGADLVFLVADVDDWPATLYRRLGFSDLFRMASFAR